MVDRSAIESALLLADRGYESYNNLAHIQEKGWNFLIRIKDGTAGIASGLALPATDEFDVPFHLNLPRTSRKYDPAVFFELHFRIVRFPISDTACETIITNLDASAFPLHDIKRLYAMRWGIETSFRNLKHTLGLLHLHAKKVEFVLQEIFAKLTMYNFCELITQSVVIRQAQKTHTYKVNFSDAVHICRQFFLGDVPPPILEAMLMRYISPIRLGRKDTRKLTQKSSASFTYRVA